MVLVLSYKIQLSQDLSSHKHLFPSQWILAAFFTNIPGEIFRDFP